MNCDLFVFYIRKLSPRKYYLEYSTQSRVAEVHVHPGVFLTLAYRHSLLIASICPPGFFSLSTWRQGYRVGLVLPWRGCCSCDGRCSCVWIDNCLLGSRQSRRQHPTKRSTATRKDVLHGLKSLVILWQNIISANELFGVIAARGHSLSASALITKVSEASTLRSTSSTAALQLPANRRCITRNEFCLLSIGHASIAKALVDRLQSPVAAFSIMAGLTAPLIMIASKRLS
jgi:hypothetical protein